VSLNCVAYDWEEQPFLFAVQVSLSAIVATLQERVSAKIGIEGMAAMSVQLYTIRPPPAMFDPSLRTDPKRELLMPYWTIEATKLSIIKQTDIHIVVDIPQFTERPTKRRRTEDESAGKSKVWS
jgi:hypothetical protein